MRNIVEFLPRGTAARVQFRRSGSQHWEPRLVIIWGLRDLKERPLSTKAIAERPGLERGRYLLYVWDITRGDWRRMYLNRIRSVELTDLNPLLAIAAGMQRSAEMHKRTA